MQINLSFPFPPVAKERARVTRFGAYTPARTKEFQRMFQWHCRKMYVDNPLGVPLKVVLEFHMPKPKKSKFGYWPGVRPDIDNLSKAVMDAGNGILWKDDALICALFCTKVYAPDKPKIRLTITTLLEELK
jgi:Holliday junction resolvase RusA-like endonuclease